MAWWARTTRRTRVVKVVAAALAIGAAGLAAATLLLPAALAGFVRGLELALNGAVWLATSLDAGADSWTIAATIGAAVARALLTPRAVAALGLLVLIGAAALYGLQRLLGLEEE
jgi:hypothetical protein